MSIVSVDNIQPVGSGTSVTVNSAATLVVGNTNSSGVVTATSFVGSGANLTGLPAEITINNNGTSKVITGSGTPNTLNANVNLTFDGTTLDVKSGTGIVNTGQLKVGTAATIATNGNATFSGIVTASKFKGDGSELTGVSGFSTALSNDTASLLNQIFKTNNTYNVGAGTSVTIQSDIGSGNIAFTRLQHINVGTGATLHIGAGTTFLMNVLKVF